MSEGARGDPQVVRSEKLPSTSEVSGQPTVGQSRFFVDGEEDVQVPHHPQNRVVGVFESLRELPQRDRRKKQLDLWVLGQKGVRRPVDTRNTFALQPVIVRPLVR